MAIRTWLDVNGDWENVNNWSGGAVPAIGDTARILEGNKSITTNLDQSAINNLIIQVGELFSGNIGLPANPLLTGTGTDLYFNSSRCKGFTFTPDTCDLLKIGQTGDYDNAFRVEGGTFTEVIVGTAKHLTIAAGTLTLLNVLGGAQPLNDTQIEIETGVVVTAAIIKGGRIISNADLGSIYLKGDCWVTQESPTTGDVTFLQLDHSAARFDWDAENSTITNMIAYSGWLNGGNFEATRILTASQAWTGATIIMPNVLGNVTYTAAMKIYGNPNLIGNISTDILIDTGGAAAL
jgi:hypothetical protein